MQTRSRSQFGYTAIALLSLVFFLLLVIPAFMSIVLSAQSYSPLSGLANSMFVGFENYARFFSSFNLPNLFFNSIRLSLIGGVLPVVIGMVVARLICESGAKPLFLGGLLLPAFIPSVIYTVFTLSVIPSTMNITMVGFDISFFIVSGIPTLFFSAFFCSAFGHMMKNTSLGSSKGATIAGLILLLYSLANILSPNAEAIEGLTNPLNYQYSETIDGFVYRTSLMMIDFSYGAAIWVVKLVIQIIVLIIAAIFFLPIIGRLNVAFNTISETGGGMYQYTTYQPTSEQNNIFPALVGCFVATAVVVLTLSLQFLFGNVTTELPSMFSVSFFNTVLVTTAASTLFALILGLTVYAGISFIPYNSPNLQTDYIGEGAGDNTGKIIGLMAISLASLSLLPDNIVGGYLYYMNLGLVNTHLPIILSELIKPELLLCAAVLCIVAVKTQTGTTGRLNTILPYIIMYLGLFIANLLGSSRYEIIYANDPLLFSLAGTARNTALHIGEFQIIIMLCIALPPLLLGGLAMAFNKRFN